MFNWQKPENLSTFDIFIWPQPDDDMDICFYDEKIFISLQIIQSLCEFFGPNINIQHEYCRKFITFIN